MTLEQISLKEVISEHIRHFNKQATEACLLDCDNSFEIMSNNEFISSILCELHSDFESSDFEVKKDYTFERECKDYKFTLDYVKDGWTGKWSVYFYFGEHDYGTATNICLSLALEEALYHMNISINQYYVKGGCLVVKKVKTSLFDLCKINYLEGRIVYKRKLRKRKLTHKRYRFVSYLRVSY